MRVLCVNSSIDLKSGGGTAERTVKLAKHLNRYGVEASVLTTNVGVNEDLRKSLNGIELHVPPLLIDRYQVPQCSLKYLKKIVKKADVIHLMNHWTFFNAIIYVLCRHFRKPYVVCPAGALPIFGRSRLLKRIYNLVIGYKIIQNATAHVGITNGEKGQFKDYGVDPKSVNIIPNGISPEEFVDKNGDEFRKKHSIGNNPFILFLGRLNLIKGPDLLLNAFTEIRKQFPDYHLVYAGPDEGMLEVLKSVVERKQIQKFVHFIGYIGGKEKSQAYHEAELLAITSRQEAMSIVVLEAGGAGTPILLTDVCGFDQIEEIGGGVIVRPTAAGIQKGLSKLLDDRQRMKQMGSTLNRFVLENFTWNAVVQKYIRLFSKILNDNSRI